MPPHNNNNNGKAFHNFSKDSKDLRNSKIVNEKQISQRRLPPDFWSQNLNYENAFFQSLCFYFFSNSLAI